MEKKQYICDCCGKQDIPKSPTEPMRECDTAFVHVFVEPRWAGISAQPYSAPDGKDICTDCFHKMWDAMGWGGKQ